MFIHRIQNTGTIAGCRNNIKGGNGLLYKNGNDVFVKNITFSAAKKDADDKYSFDEFKKWADKTDFTSKIKDLVDYTGKILGSGFEGTTYEIPDCNKWVVKTFKRGSMLPVPSDKEEITKITDIAPKINAGQSIAKITVPNGKNFSLVYYILKKQTGAAHGVCYDESEFVDSTNIKLHLESLKKLSKLPQSTFDKCVRDARYINAQGFDFDCGNPENFLINTKTKSINFVDINDYKTANTSPYGEILFALLDGYFAINFNEGCKDADCINQAQNYSDVIIDKYFKSMLKYGLKFDDDRHFKELLDSRILDNILGCSERCQKTDKLKELKLL